MIAILPHQKSIPLRLFLLRVSSSCQPRENRVHDNRVRENRVRENRVRESRVRDLKNKGRSSCDKSIEPTKCKAKLVG